MASAAAAAVAPRVDLLVVMLGEGAGDGAAGTNGIATSIFSSGTFSGDLVLDFFLGEAKPTLGSLAGGVLPPSTSLAVPSVAAVAVAVAVRVVDAPVSPPSAGAAAGASSPSSALPSSLLAPIKSATRSLLLSNESDPDENKLARDCAAVRFLISLVGGFGLGVLNGVVVVDAALVVVAASVGGGGGGAAVAGVVDDDASPPSADGAFASSAVRLSDGIGFVEDMSHIICWGGTDSDGGY